MSNIISTLVRFLRFVTPLPHVRVKVTWIDPENSELDFPSPRYVFMLTGGYVDFSWKRSIINVVQRSEIINSDRM